VNLAAVDPGSEQSAFVILADGVPIRHGKISNHTLLDYIRSEWCPEHGPLAIEMIASYGMPVGREVFETVLWIGRFMEAWQSRGGKVQLVYRRDVKLFHCETSKANDSNIRAALIDRYGPGKERAIGLKARPGPLYGIKADEWSALALALTVEGRRHITHPPRDAFEAMEAG
jgi:hypothetical protein